ncbi:hypothetical protein [Lentzea californiensis]|uniref:hypothetical protein n=1 Tax=Lentzea californiensis TaxID=438851 RepID=UPI0021662DBC|nr:hypothetical protein [Lentzea californiensis]MCR3753294.1 Short repeat-containing protein of unknown function [Lentzea californiensis]
MKNTRSRKLISLLLAFATVASTVVVTAPQAAAEEPEPQRNDRMRVMSLWRLGGPAVKDAAAGALVGTDADIASFVNGDSYRRAAESDDRGWLSKMLETGGVGVKQGAQQALDAGTPAAIRDFLNTGWQNAQNLDVRIGLNQAMAVSGPNVRAKVQEALDSNDPSIQRAFLQSGWQDQEKLDQRIKVNQLMSVGGPRVRAKAQEALDAGTLEAYTNFMTSEWPIAQARDDELASVAELAQVAKAAGELAIQETQAAKDASARAVAEAQLAKEAAERAAKATEAAKNNADEAARFAGVAADAATRAARSAGEAVSAANNATNAARMAASAASRAASAAAAAGQSASAAYNAAAAAVADRNKAGDARNAAVKARDDAARVDEAAEAARLAADAARNALSAAQSAVSTSQHAAAAAIAAANAGNFADQAGADAQAARSAAALAQREAERAKRAATAAETFANASAAAADRSRAAALKAGTNAREAADAAQQAADHAVEADKQAAEATKHANAATTAAENAVTASNQAKTIYDAARVVEDENLKIHAEQVRAAAQETKATFAAAQPAPQRDADQATRRDAGTNTLIAEATAPGAAESLVVSHGRKIALRLASSDGEWTRRAAEAALVGADAEVAQYVRHGVQFAAGRDDRNTLEIIAADGTQRLKDAANAALSGSDADIVRFLRDKNYVGRDQDDRIKINQVMAAERQENRTITAAAAQKALDVGTAAAYQKFLKTDRFNTAVVDDRVAVNRIVSDPASGPETKAMGNAVLDGSPAAIKQWLESGRYSSIRRDAEAAAHIAEVSTLLSVASKSAATAVQAANEAQAVAATARGAAAEAAQYAQQARSQATEAAKYAQDASASAQQAEQSAQKAAESARTAKSASARAFAAARDAARSATWAESSAAQARRFANEAYASAQTAYDAKIAAGELAGEALAAADEAFKHANRLVDDMKVREAADQAAYCGIRHQAGSGEYTNCINLVGQSDDEKTARAFQNGQICDHLYGQGRESDLYKNCTADVLHPGFSENRSFELGMATMQMFMAMLTVVVVANSMITMMLQCGVVCEGLLMSVDPAGAALFPSWLITVSTRSAIVGLATKVMAEVRALQAELAAMRAARVQQATSLTRTEAERIGALGVDLAPGKEGIFSAEELRIALWGEKTYGKEFFRYSGPFDSANPDWYTADGMTYDAFGPFNAQADQFFQLNWPKTSNSLLKHSAKSDIVLLDVTGLSPGNEQQILQYIRDKSLPNIVVVR